ncbi:hypothetical protein [Streptomyces xantholiticus]|uniref:Secreted protein n=1 Tax=Streptomyces xantholiticus TaxID=68285 RepID=A0ABV1V3Z8_9ACTN
MSSGSALRLHVCAAAVAVVALVGTGCSGGGGGGASAAEPSPSSTGSATGTTPSSSPTPLYPTNAAGCHPNEDWSREETLSWVRLETVTPDDITSDGNEVRIRKSSEGFDGPLCKPVSVQVEVWKLTYGSAEGREPARDRTKPKPDYYFSMQSVKRSELRVDGTEEEAVPLPGKLYAADRSVCVGALIAVYVGKPLTAKELPEEIDIGGSASDVGTAFGDNIEFRTERVAVEDLSEPAAPHVCSPEGKPTADPTDVPDPAAPGLPDPRYPRDRPSFDLDDILRPSPSF